MEKTTDVRSVVDSLSHSGEPGTPPATPLDPRIAEVLPPDLAASPAELAGFQAEAPGWLARWELALVIKAILEAVARKRAGDDGSKAPIRSTVASYTAGILETWEREGHCTSRLSRPKPADPPAINAPTADVIEANRARQAAAREPDPRDLWHALDPVERSAIEAEFDRDNSRATDTPPSFWRAQRMVGCFEMMKARMKAGAVGGSP